MSSWAPALGPHLADRFHRQARVALDEDVEDGLPLVVEQRSEDLREVGGMLLLQQIQQVGGRTNAQQSFDRVEDDINSARRSHSDAPVFRSTTEEM